MRFQQLTQVNRFQTTRITSVMMIQFVFHLFTRYRNFISDNYHDIIASIDVRRLLRLVLSTQAAGHFSRQATEHYIMSIDNTPVAFNALRFC